ncbi:peptide ABC transporter substrate-binding protein [Candidatus Neptunochlamydia vexilliferae]|nr:peptide ABC transporter substrate-binding protein [Candidatus Neptunochlamydia vexilliferae]
MKLSKVDAEKSTAWILLAILLIAGCLIFFQKCHFDKSEQTLRISLVSDVQSMDISQSHDTNSEQVISLVFEGLMRKDSNGVPQLALAKEVIISEDQKTYTFHLRETKWSDGTPLTAHDFEYSWKRSMDPHSKFVCRSPYYFYDIKKGKASLKGEVSSQEVGVRAIDPNTLVVDLEHPTPYFLELTTLSFFFPIPKHIAENNPKWGTTIPLICNGPFHPDHWKRNDSIHLTKNLHYWDCSHVYLDGISISIINDPLTTLFMFEKGELDWVGSPFVRVSYDTSSETLNQEYDDVLIYWFNINTQKYPFNHQKIRQALSYAIDRKSIVSNVFHQAGIPRASILPPAITLSEKPLFQDNDPNQAKKLFEEALYELNLTRKTFPEITLSYVANVEIHHRIAQAIQDQWRDALGIHKVTLKQTEWNIHYDALCRGDYDVGFLAWNVSVLDPIFILEIFRNRDNTNNTSFWEDPHYITLLDQAKASLSPVQRTHLLKQAEEHLLEQMPVIPICSLKKRFAKNPTLKGETLLPLQLIDFKSAYFETSPTVQAPFP